MDAIKAINMGLSFLLELGMLAALGFWGFKTGQGWVVKALLGIGLPLIAAVIWGFFCAPKAARRLDGLALAGLEIVLLGTGSLALFAAGQTGLAWVYTAALVINRILWIVWKQ